MECVEEEQCKNHQSPQRTGMKMGKKQIININFSKLRATDSKIQEAQRISVKIELNYENSD